MNASAVIAESLLRQACTRLPQHAGGRARRSVGQRTPGSMPPSFAAPPWPIATRKATGPPRARLPGTPCSEGMQGVDATNRHE